MSAFLKGMRHGIPIALGYLSVSFGFGILAAKHFGALVATVISMTNLTSAGQLAGVNIMAEGNAAISGYLEMALTQLIINMRYGLMGISLSQKLDSSVNFFNKLPSNKKTLSFVLISSIKASLITSG